MRFICARISHQGTEGPSPLVTSVQCSSTSSSCVLLYCALVAALQLQVLTHVIELPENTCAERDWAPMSASAARLCCTG